MYTMDTFAKYGSSSSSPYTDVKYTIKYTKCDFTSKWPIYFGQNRKIVKNIENARQANTWARHEIAKCGTGNVNLQ